MEQHILKFKSLLEPKPSESYSDEGTKDETTGEVVPSLEQEIQEFILELKNPN